MTDHREATIRRLVKKGGLRASIDAMCCSCTYDPLGAGTWRKQVDSCAITSCPLHPVRPRAKYRDRRPLDADHAE